MPSKYLMLNIYPEELCTIWEENGRTIVLRYSQQNNQISNFCIYSDGFPGTEFYKYTSIHPLKLNTFLEVIKLVPINNIIGILKSIGINMSILTGKQIVENNILSNIVDIENQVQPCGVDLTVSKIEMYKSEGVIDLDNSKRKLPRLEERGMFVEFSNITKDGSIVNHNTTNNKIWKLTPGAYLITLNEVVSVPADCMGIARPRSSLLRMGATMETSVWDPGYTGRSQCMLVVHNPQGIQIYPNAKLLQIVFMKLNETSEVLYSGQYQGENINEI